MGAGGVFPVNMKTLRELLFAAVLGHLAVAACLAAEKPQTAETPKEPEPEKVFDLRFPGGPAQLLVSEIEKAAKVPLNVIIPDEHKEVFLPPLKLRNVTVPQLFEAVTAASESREIRITGYNYGAGGRVPQYQYVTTRFGFRTADPKQPARANSIWYFYVDSPPQPPTPEGAQPPQPRCRFWQLEPYLEKLKVEDITTAIETGWKMLGVNPLPKLSFHKDTKLLIVVGPDTQLSIVDEVLRELTSAKKSTTNKPVPMPLPVPDEKR